MLAKKLIFSTFLFTAFFSFAQSDLGNPVNTELIKVNNNIYMLQGKGGNIGLCIGNDGVFMIDDQFAEGIDQVKEEIKKVSKKPVQFLVNTHFHGDHTGGNSAMAETGTIIFSQENVRTRLEEMINKESKKGSEKVLPMITFSEDLSFYYNNEKIYVFHVHNAHTDGDAMVYFTKSNVLHTGDVFFNGKYPYIDLENGGSVKGCIEALQKASLVINEGTKIIPGHGDLGTLKDIKNSIDMLSLLYKKVTYYYMSQKSEEEIIKMTDLTQEYDSKGFGTGFINREAFLKTIYKEVANDMKEVDERNQNNIEAAKKIEEMKKNREKKD